MTAPTLAMLPPSVAKSDHEREQLCRRELPIRGGDERRLQRAFELACVGDRVEVDDGVCGCRSRHSPGFVPAYDKPMAIIATSVVRTSSS